MAGIVCYVIHLNYTILPLTDMIHICRYVVQTLFSGSQPFIYIWASVKLGDTLGMPIWLETINGI